jgi:predicted anti-sigma-YlaC factor YlaD
MIPCCLHRLLATFWLDGDAPAPGPVRRHLAACAGCRAAVAAHRAVAQTLARTASARQEPLPPFLPARIEAGWRAGREPASARRHAVRWTASAAVACVALALLLLVLPDRPSGPRDAGRSAGEGITVWGATAAWPEGAALGDPQRWTAALQQPLEGELALAVEDGHRLFASAIRSCLPEPTAAAVVAQTRRLLPPRAGPGR